MKKQKREYCRRDPSRWPRSILYPQKLTVTSPTSSGRSVGIVRPRTQATKFSFIVTSCDCKWILENESLKALGSVVWIDWWVMGPLYCEVNRPVLWDVWEFVSHMTDVFWRCQFSYIKVMTRHGNLVTHFRLCTHGGQTRSVDIFSVWIRPFYLHVLFTDEWYIRILDKGESARSMREEERTRSMKKKVKSERKIWEPSLLKQPYRIFPVTC
jgi:hypothetical protein